MENITKEDIFSLIDKGLKSSSVGEFFIYSKEYEWMKNNAHKYGFILRYEKDKEHITGYNAEAWHFRYVGEEVAKYIYENKITYEEYYAMNYS